MLQNSGPSTTNNVRRFIDTNTREGDNTDAMDKAIRFM
jgi:hypothetical protein